MPTTPLHPIDAPIAKAFLHSKQLVMTQEDSGYATSAMKDLVIAAMLNPDDKTGKQVDMSRYANYIQAHYNQRDNLSAARNQRNNSTSYIPDRSQEHSIAIYDQTFANMVIDYQKSHGITPTSGNIGQKTKDALAQDLERLEKAKILTHDRPHKRYAGEPEHIHHYLHQLKPEQRADYLKEHKAFNSKVESLLNELSAASYDLPSLAALGVTQAPAHGAATMAYAPNREHTTARKFG